MTVHILLRRQPAQSANALQRAFSWLIKARTVSEFCHSGMEIDGHLYHVTGAHGYQVARPGEWNPELWDHVYVDVDPDVARARFFECAASPEGMFQRFVYFLTKGYDFFSLFAFAGLPVSVMWLNYCYELSRYMATGQKSRQRATAEQLLILGLQCQSRQQS